MYLYIERKRTRFPFQLLSALVVIAFTFSLITPPVYAQGLPGNSALNLPNPGAMVPASPAFQPAVIAGLQINPDNPLRFNFIIDKGDSGLDGLALKDESEKLIKYFLAAMTVPADDLWVNLSPYEGDRIIPEKFGYTEMGKDLLAQDYLLKQLTATLLYPEDELGANFWKEVYARAQKIYGTTSVPVNTFNKVWIVPEKARIFAQGDTAMIVESHLKVMLEGDYLALLENLESEERGTNRLTGKDVEKLSDVSSEIIRNTIIPAIEEEVNKGQNFAPLRQIYNSMILATWYKKNLKESLLSKVYAEQNKITGVDLDDKTLKDQIYQQYLEAFEVGVFNYIREDTDTFKNKKLPRKYFSGGFEGGAINDVFRADARIGDLERSYSIRGIDISNLDLSGESESNFVSVDAALDPLQDFGRQVEAIQARERTGTITEQDLTTLHAFAQSNESFRNQYRPQIVGMYNRLQNSDNSQIAQLAGEYYQEESRRTHKIVAMDWFWKVKGAVKRFDQARQARDFGEMDQVVAQTRSDLNPTQRALFLIQIIGESDVVDASYFALNQLADLLSSDPKLTENKSVRKAMSDIWEKKGISQNPVLSNYMIGFMDTIRFDESSATPYQGEVTGPNLALYLRSSPSMDQSASFDNASRAFFEARRLSSRGEVNFLITSDIIARLKESPLDQAGQSKSAAAVVLRLAELFVDDPALFTPAVKTKIKELQDLAELGDTRGLTIYDNFGKLFNFMESIQNKAPHEILGVDPTANRETLDGALNRVAANLPERVSQNILPAMEYYSKLRAHRRLTNQTLDRPSLPTFVSSPGQDLSTEKDFMRLPVEQRVMSKKIRDIGTRFVSTATPEGEFRDEAFGNLVAFYSLIDAVTRDDVERLRRPNDLLNDATAYRRVEARAHLFSVEAAREMVSDEYGPSGPSADNRTLVALMQLIDRIEGETPFDEIAINNEQIEIPYAPTRVQIANDIFLDISVDEQNPNVLVIQDSDNQAVRIGPGTEYGDFYRIGRRHSNPFGITARGPGTVSRTHLEIRWDPESRRIRFIDTSKVGTAIRPQTEQSSFVIRSSNERILRALIQEQGLRDQELSLRFIPTNGLIVGVVNQPSRLTQGREILPINVTADGLITSRVERRDLERSINLALDDYNGLRQGPDLASEADRVYDKVRFEIEPGDGGVRRLDYANAFVAHPDPMAFARELQAQSEMVTEPMSGEEIFDSRKRFETAQRIEDVEEDQIIPLVVGPEDIQDYYSGKALGNVLRSIVNKNFGSVRFVVIVDSNEQIKFLNEGDPAEGSPTQNRSQFAWELVKSNVFDFTDDADLSSEADQVYDKVRFEIEIGDGGVYRQDYANAFVAHPDPMAFARELQAQSEMVTEPLQGEEIFDSRQRFQTADRIKALEEDQIIPLVVGPEDIQDYYSGKALGNVLRSIVNGSAAAVRFVVIVDSSEKIKFLNEGDPAEGSPTQNRSQFAWELVKSNVFDFTTDADLASEADEAFLRQRIVANKIRLGVVGSYLAGLTEDTTALLNAVEAVVYNNPALLDRPADALDESVEASVLANADKFSFEQAQAMVLQRYGPEGSTADAQKLNQYMTVFDAVDREMGAQDIIPLAKNEAVSFDFINEIDLLLPDGFTFTIFRDEGDPTNLFLKNQGDPKFTIPFGRLSEPFNIVVGATQESPFGMRILGSALEILDESNKQSTDKVMVSNLNGRITLSSLTDEDVSVSVNVEDNVDRILDRNFAELSGSVLAVAEVGDRNKSIFIRFAETSGAILNLTTDPTAATLEYSERIRLQDDGTLVPVGSSIQKLHPFVQRTIGRFNADEQLVNLAKLKPQDLSSEGELVQAQIEFDRYKASLYLGNVPYTVAEDEIERLRATLNERPNVGVRFTSVFEAAYDQFRRALLDEQERLGRDMQFDEVQQFARTFRVQAPLIPPAAVSIDLSSESGKLPPVSPAGQRWQTRALGELTATHSQEPAFQAGAVKTNLTTVLEELVGLGETAQELPQLLDYPQVGDELRNQWRARGYEAQYGNLNQYLGLLMTEFTMDSKQFEQIKDRVDLIIRPSSGNVGNPQKREDLRMALWAQGVALATHIRYFGPHSEMISDGPRAGTLDMLDTEYLVKVVRELIPILLLSKDDPAFSAPVRVSPGYSGETLQFKGRDVTQRDIMLWGLLTMLDPMIHNYLSYGLFTTEQTKLKDARDFIRARYGSTGRMVDKISRDMLLNLKYIDENGNEVRIKNEDIDALLSEAFKLFLEDDIGDFQSPFGAYVAAQSINEVLKDNERQRLKDSPLVDQTFAFALNENALRKIYPSGIELKFIPSVGSSVPVGVENYMLFLNQPWVQRFPQLAQTITDDVGGVQTTRRSYQVRIRAQHSSEQDLSSENEIQLAMIDNVIAPSLRELVEEHEYVLDRRDLDQLMEDYLYHIEHEGDRPFNDQALMSIASILEKGLDPFTTVRATGAVNTRISPTDLDDVKLVFERIRRDPTYRDLSAESRSFPTTPERVGGIDINPALLELQEEGQGLQFELPFEPKIFNEMPVDGFAPVIFQIMPINNLPQIIGRGEGSSSGPLAQLHLIK